MPARGRRRRIQSLLTVLAPLPAATAHEVACALGEDRRGARAARGTLHALLDSCVHDGLVAVERGGGRRRYWLTALGQRVLSDLEAGRPRHPEVAV